MKIKFLIIGILTFIMLASVAAAVPTGGVAYWNFDDLTDKWSSHVLVNDGGATSNSTYPTFNTTGNSASSSLSFYATNDDYLSIADHADFDFTTEMSASIWVYTPAIGGNADTLISKFDNAGADGYMIYVEPGAGATSSTYFFAYGLTTTNSGATTYPNDEWVNLVATYDGTNICIYVNGVEGSCNAATGNIGTNNDALMVNRYGTTSDYGYHTLDELQLYDYGLNETEIENIYNYGNITGGTPTPPTSNTTIYSPNTIAASGNVTVLINSAAYVTVYSANFTLPYDSELIIDRTTNILGWNTASETKCATFIDSVEYGSSTVSVPKKDYRSTFATTNSVSLTSGAHLAELKCYSTNNERFYVAGSTGIFTILTNEDNNTIIHEYSSVAGVGSFNVWTNLTTQSFTTTANNYTSDFVKSAVLEWGEAYTFVSSNNIGSKIDLNGTESVPLKRYGTNGATGSGAGFMMITGLTNASETISFTPKVWQDGVSAGEQINFTYVVKEMITGVNEINYTGNSASTTITTSWTTLDTLTVNNTNFVGDNLNVKTALSIDGDGTATDNYLELRVKIVSENGSVTYRSVGDAIFRYGVAINIFTFENVGEGVHTITLEAKASAENTDVYGLNMLAYLTYRTSATPNVFNVTAYDYNDNSLMLSNITATTSNGLTLSTTGGILIFPQAGTINITVNATDNGGYLNHTTTNHDSSTALNSSLWQAEVTFYTFQALTNNSISGSDCSINITSNQACNVTFYVGAGVQEVTANITPYYDKTINVTVVALDKKSFNIEEMFNSVIHFNATDYLQSIAIINYTIQDYETQTYSYTNTTTTNGNLSIYLVQGINYTFTFYSTGYIRSNYSLAPNATEYNYTWTAYEAVSFRVMFIDEETLENVTNVTFQVFNELYSNEFNTGVNNTYFLEDLPEGEFFIRYNLENGSDYARRSYYVILPHTDANNTEISLYCLEFNNSQLFVRTLTDSNAQPLEGYYLQLQRAYASTDNTSFNYETVEIGKANSQGEVVFSAIPNVQQYRMRVVDTNFNLVNIQNPTYLIDQIADIVISLGGSLTYEVDAASGVSYTNITYHIPTTNFVFDYTDIGNATEICMFMKYNYKFEENLTTKCSSNHGDTLTITAPNGTIGHYLITAYAVVNGYEVTLDVYNGDLGFSVNNVAYTVGPLFYILFIMLCATLTGFVRPEIGIGLAIIGTLALSMSVFKILSLGALSAGALLLLGGLVIFLYRKGGDT